MHLTESSHVPELGRKITAFLDLRFIEPNVLSRRRDPHQAKSQTVRTVLADQLEWIRRIAERLRHLPAEFVTNDAGEENMVKRNVVANLAGSARHELKPGDN